MLLIIFHFAHTISWCFLVLICHITSLIFCQPESFALLPHRVEPNHYPHPVCIFTLEITSLSRLLLRWLTGFNLSSSLNTLPDWCGREMPKNILHWQRREKNKIDKQLKVDKLNHCDSQWAKMRTKLWVLARNKPETLGYFAGYLLEISQRYDDRGKRRASLNCKLLYMSKSKISPERSSN